MANISTDPATDGLTRAPLAGLAASTMRACSFTAKPAVRHVVGACYGSRALLITSGRKAVRMLSPKDTLDTGRSAQADQGNPVPAQRESFSKQSTGNDHEANNISSANDAVRPGSGAQAVEGDPGHRPVQRPH